jgi:hypothetical protein
MISGLAFALENRDAPVFGEQRGRRRPGDSRAYDKDIEFPIGHIARSRTSLDPGIPTLENSFSQSENSLTNIAAAASGAAASPMSILFSN